MKTYYIDEKVTVWKRCRIEIPDDADIIEIFKEFGSSDGIACNTEFFADSEYLLETEDSYEPIDPEEHTTEIYDENWKLIRVE